MLPELTDFATGVLRNGFVAFVRDFVLFNLGRAALLLVTAGRYPRGRSLQAHTGRISAVGILVLLLAWCGIALHNHFATGTA